MTDTAAYSNRNNAKRAAEKMIMAGTAPAVDYGIEPCDDGRFEIKWKTNPAPGTDEAEAETIPKSRTAGGTTFPGGDPLSLRTDGAPDGSASSGCGSRAIGPAASAGLTTRRSRRRRGRRRPNDAAAKTQRGRGGALDNPARRRNSRGLQSRPNLQATRPEIRSQRAHDPQQARAGRGGRAEERVGEEGSSAGIDTL
jgi:hypothetical protein